MSLDGCLPGLAPPPVPAPVQTPVDAWVPCTDAWTAEDVKERLRGRHAGGFQGPMVGEWTCLEEWRGIDLLAISAWQSSKYRRVGYEVKISRSDLRRELLRPDKRAHQVALCDEFWFAVPAGLLTPDEKAYVEPEWEDEDFARRRCPAGCCKYRGRRGTFARVPVPATLKYPGENYEWCGWTNWPCERCDGKGYEAVSRVERDAPTLWIPADVGLVEVSARGTHVVRKAPRTKPTDLSWSAVADLVRWASARPDPRHRRSAA